MAARSTPSRRASPPRAPVSGTSRRFEFAQLEHGTEAEARAALDALHGAGEDVISEISVSKAL